MKKPRSSFEIPSSTGRLVALLVIVVCIGIDLYFVYRPQPEIRAPSPTPSLLPALSPAVSEPPSPTPNHTARPVATPLPIIETTYQTSGGLRYADRDFYQKGLGQATTMAQATNELSSFLSQYGVGVWTTETTLLPHPKTDSMTWSLLSPTDPKDLTNVKLFGSWLIDEWSKYPKIWVRLSGIQDIAIVNNITDQGNAVGSVALPGGSIFYSLKTLNKVATVTSGTEDYYRGTIQHEVSHEVGNYLQGGTDSPDPTWTSFNPPGFSYGQIGTTVIHPLGFTTNYGQTNIGEDKAEVYSYLFVGSRNKELAEWEKSDPYLAQKVADYKAFIKSNVSIMNDTYFANINP